MESPCAKLALPVDRLDSVPSRYVWNVAWTKQAFQLLHPHSKQCAMVWFAIYMSTVSWTKQSCTSVFSIKAVSEGLVRALHMDCFLDRTIVCASVFSFKAMREGLGRVCVIGPDKLAACLTRSPVSLLLICPNILSEVSRTNGAVGCVQEQRRPFA